MTAHFDVTSRVVETFESSTTSVVALIAMDVRTKRTRRGPQIQVAEITRSRGGRIIDQMPFYWDTQLINNEA